MGLRAPKGCGSQFCNLASKVQVKKVKQVTQRKLEIKGMRNPQELPFQCEVFQGSVVFVDLKSQERPGGSADFPHSDLIPCVNIYTVSQVGLGWVAQEQSLTQEFLFQQ